MNLLPIEIKVNIEGDVAAAMSALGAAGAATTTRRIWFAEDRDAVAEGRVRLLDEGVIVRFRIGGGPDELTVKLRPCTLEQLVGRFAGPFDATPLTYRIERDWAADRRVVAASLTHGHPSGALLSAVQPGADSAVAIGVVQEQFLDVCAPDVQVDGLVALGPVHSTKADDVALGDLEVDLEAWRVAGLQFLEASTRVKPKDGEEVGELTARAERRQRKLEEAVRELGVTLSELPDSKTHRVLTALVAAGRS
ncbi:hypothetical protein [Streptomyces sp. NPDC056480]|uniref:hypothetical protein n=1 Tax=Streptomyces sp. NPDC056480 TaxID=3345833 RepID=UPI0036C6A19A